MSAERMLPSVTTSYSRAGGGVGDGVGAAEEVEDAHWVGLIISSGACQPQRVGGARCVWPYRPYRPHPMGRANLWALVILICAGARNAVTARAPSPSPGPSRPGSDRGPKQVRGGRVREGGGSRGVGWGGSGIRRARLVPKSLYTTCRGCRRASCYHATN
jgi:hypothetical protein